MIRKISFIRKIPKTVRVLCYGLARASSAGEFYSQCSSMLPPAAAYYLTPWLHALYQGEAELVSKEAERLWKLFRYSPVLRMLVNLLFAIPYVWENRECLCDLLFSLGNLPGRKILYGNVPDELLYIEGALIHDSFGGLEQIQLLLYQCPCGLRGRRIRTCLNKVLGAARSNLLVQTDVLGELAHCCKDFGEFQVILYASLTLFEKESERLPYEEAV